TARPARGALIARPTDATNLRLTHGIADYRAAALSRGGTTPRRRRPLRIAQRDVLRRSVVEANECSQRASAVVSSFLVPQGLVEGALSGLVISQQNLLANGSVRF